MNDQMNGAVPPQATPEQIAQNNAVLNQIEAQCSVAIHAVLRGLLVGFQGIPPHVVVAACAHQCGVFLGAALQGSTIANNIEIRKMITTSFESGVKKSPVIKPSGAGSNWSPPNDGKAT